MSGRRRKTLSPTLFPFLAVLVCTLGTLILLLALVAQNTSDAAQQIAETAEQERTHVPGQLTVGDVELLVEEEEFRLGELISFREAQTGDLEDRRNQLAHVEDHMRRIRQRLKQIGEAMEQAMSDDPPSAATAEELKSLNEQLVKEQLVVKKLREEIKTAKPRFVIVPHQGPNGTERRPIYLECTAKGVTIWPEGVAITRTQLEQTSRHANPLDDALRAARYHAMQQYGDAIPPYPMLLVRPEGVDSYYAARSAMLDWDDQFGYELVPADVNLAYPNPDPAMRERMEYAINQALDRMTQQSIARSIRGSGSRSPAGPGGTGGNFDRQASVSGGGQAPAASGQAAVAESPSGGAGWVGSHAVQPPEPVKPVPRLSVSQMDRQGRQSGFRDHRMFPTPTYGRTGSRAGGGNPSPITSEAAKRRLERQLQDSASSFAEVDSDRDLNQAAMTAVDQIAAGTNSGSSDQSQPQPNTPGANALELQYPSSGDADSASAMLAQGNADSGGRQRVIGKASAQAGDNPAGIGPMAGAPMGMNRLDQPKVSQRMKAGQPTDAQAANAADQKPAASEQAKSRKPGSLVQRNGADWALPSSVVLARGNEIVRSVRLQVHADRFILLPDAGMRQSETFLIEPDGVNVATLQLATSVRDRIERWGAAAPGARWSPRLKVDVMPGAELRYDQWSRLMTGSGLPIQRTGDDQGAGYTQAENNPRGERK
ncbi:hypothetical protein NZK35_28865 [Stieleria sp. ICT_E10.1]|uniref:hypothetical protein n=1 Tax=Stieleria sedimenti TaxID=2976331 RepID=UPI00217FAA58|nr:hypothetical protein [Stieleria sedimenti]MCS7470683.1 hypothetical protein [Stieleria sedimenti]